MLRKRRKRPWKRRDWSRRKLRRHPTL